MKSLVVVTAMLFSMVAHAEGSKDELKLPVAIQSPKTGKVLVQAKKQATYENEKEEQLIIQELQKDLLIEAEVQKTGK